MHPIDSILASASMYSSSLGIKAVLINVATPPASAVPKVAVMNSARLVISMPKRSPLPRPSAVSVLAADEAQRFAELAQHVAMDSIENFVVLSL